MGDAADDEVLRRVADELLAGVVAAVPGWVDRSTRAVLAATGRPVDGALAARIDTAARDARAEVADRLGALLAADIDEQRTNPLQVVRDAVRHPTGVLLDAGVPLPARDEFAQRSFPDDHYGLAPATFADLDPALHDVGLRWGAAKAAVHLRRHSR